MGNSKCNRKVQEVRSLIKEEVVIEKIVPCPNKVLEIRM